MLTGTHSPGLTDVCLHHDGGPRWGTELWEPASTCPMPRRRPQWVRCVCPSVPCEPNGGSVAGGRTKQGLEHQRRGRRHLAPPEDWSDSGHPTWSLTEYDSTRRRPLPKKECIYQFAGILITFCNFTHYLSYGMTLTLVWHSHPNIKHIIDDWLRLASHVIQRKNL